MDKTQLYQPCSRLIEDYGHATVIEGQPRLVVEVNDVAGSYTGDLTLAFCNDVPESDYGITQLDYGKKRWWIQGEAARAVMTICQPYLSEERYRLIQKIWRESCH